MINLEKLFCDLIRYSESDSKWHSIVMKALREQGLDWNGSEIVKASPYPDPEINKWYVCLRNFHIGTSLVFVKGECYRYSGSWSMLDKCSRRIGFSKDSFYKVFRLATNNEIPTEAQLSGRVNHKSFQL